jgi:hypothetical protein
VTDDEAFSKFGWRHKLSSYAVPLPDNGGIKTDPELTRRLREEAARMMPGAFKRYGL